MSGKILTEKELEEVFYTGKKKPSRFWKYFGVVLAFVALTGFFFVVLNFKSLSAKFLYWYDTEYKNQPMKETALSKVFETNPNSAQSQTTTSQIPKIADNSISIPEINVAAPISWAIPNTPDRVAAGLAKGTIQIKGTSLPGQTGNVFITGHSSNYPWAKGNYNNIFALLNKLVPGDLVQVKYQNNNFIYKVTGSKVVSPNDVSVLNETDGSILTLMTCTPVGTSINRLIVTANQIYPDPAQNIPFAGASSTNFLPSAQ